MLSSSLVCSDADFRCNNTRCISKLDKCDSINQCGDFSDERECDCGGLRKCNNGLCLSDIFWCNQRDDCGDNSDEHYCVNIGSINVP